jgi:hypothetical protein
MPQTALCRASSRGRAGAWASFEDLVGEQLHRERHFQAKPFCRLEIDHKFEFRWLEDRQIGRFRASQYLPSIDAELAIHLGHVDPIANQPSGLDELAGI